MNLKTKQRIRRTQWVKMVTTEVIIAVMNAFDDTEEGCQMEDSMKQVDAVPEKARKRRGHRRIDVGRR
jgi:hypothetical protein